MFCSFCSNTLNGNQRFCGHCGRPDDPGLFLNLPAPAAQKCYYGTIKGNMRWAWFDGSPDYRNSNRSHGFIIEFDD